MFMQSRPCLPGNHLTWCRTVAFTLRFILSESHFIKQQFALFDTNAKEDRFDHLFVHTDNHIDVGNMKLIEKVNNSQVLNTTTN